MTDVTELISSVLLQKLYDFRSYIQVWIHFELIFDVTVQFS